MITKIKSEYSDRLEGANVEELDDNDLNKIKRYLNAQFDISEESFNDSIKFHTELSSKLKFKDVDIEIDLIQVIDNSGISVIDLEKFIYVIWESPNSISKMKIRELNKIWDEVWCPPSDDALILCLPNEKIILITHYNALYYS